MIIILVLNIHTQLSSLQCHFLRVRVMIVDYAPVCTSEEKRKRERVFVILKEIKKKKCRYNVINKTRFYTHAGIEHPHEIVLLARSTTGIVDDVDEICGS